MTWLPLLLSDRSAALRYLVLKDLLGRSDDDEELAELKELRMKDPLIVSLLESQNDDGSWESSRMTGLQLDSKLRNTAQALYRLAYLKVEKEHPAIKKGVEYLFSKQDESGAWPRGDDGKLIFKHTTHGKIITSLQTSFPLRAIAMNGYAKDKRAEKGYEWLLEHRAEDGSWPTYAAPDGKISYQVVGYRQLPNSRFGCRTNSTGALLAFAYHPKRRNSEEVKRVLDLLLARETRDRQLLGFEVARILGIEPAGGFLTYFGKFDLGLLLNLCWRIGATKEDQRVTAIVEYLKKEQGKYGLWEYELNPQATRWVSYDLLVSLSKIDEKGNWVSTEPRTIYTSYVRQPGRF